jgi:hypothetical protein
MAINKYRRLAELPDADSLSSHSSCNTSMYIVTISIFAPANSPCSLCCCFLYLSLRSAVGTARGPIGAAAAGGGSQRLRQRLRASPGGAVSARRRVRRARRLLDADQRPSPRSAASARIARRSTRRDPRRLCGGVCGRAGRARRGRRGTGAGVVRQGEQPCRRRR